MTNRRRKIPNRLRKHRRLMGFSQQEVVQRLKLKCNSQLSRWERGITMPSAENLLRLSVLYKTLANELYLDLFDEYQHELRQEKKHTRSNAP